MPGLDVVEPPETRRGSYHSLHRSQHAYFGTSASCQARGGAGAGALGNRVSGSNTCSSLPFL